MIQSNKRISIYKCLGLVWVGIAFMLYERKLRKKCKLSIRQIRSIPKGMMFRMKMTSYLRKHKILDQTDIL